MNLPNDQCNICKTALTEQNVARKKHNGEIRLDSSGKAWCTTCTDNFDNIDPDELYRLG